MEPITDENIKDLVKRYLDGNSGLSEINSWDVSNVTNMDNMFKNTYQFNQSLNSWNVSNGIYMISMFEGSINFNGDISNWNVGNVTNMNNMFLSCESFNQNIGNWDVRKVTDMTQMFRNCLIFNQDISRWQPTSVQNMSGMFMNATNFNQNISYDASNNYWNTSNVIDFTLMFNAQNAPYSQNFNNGYAGGDTSHPLNWIISSSVSLPVSQMSIGSALTPAVNAAPGNATTVNAVGFVGTTKVICYNTG